MARGSHMPYCSPGWPLTPCGAPQYNKANCEEEIFLLLFEITGLPCSVFWVVFWVFCFFSSCLFCLFVY